MTPALRHRHDERDVSAGIWQVNFAQTSFITERPVTYYFRTLLPFISSGHPGFADGRDIVDFHDLMSPSFRQISRVRITPSACIRRNSSYVKSVVLVLPSITSWHPLQAIAA